MKINTFESGVLSALGRLCGKLHGKKILVGLSGGADSVSLLLALKSLSAENGFEVRAMHLNHLIRGGEAYRDEEFCKELCGKLCVPLSVERADIPAAARAAGQSLELCAREYRYKALIKLSEDNDIDYIATAHNADDNAETVLYNVLRGSGLDGVCGIPAKRGNIIRPILGKNRKEILRYLEERGQDYVTDSTNAENDYTRNYIRNVLIPSAQRVNADAVGALNRLAHAASVEAEYLNDGISEAVNGKSPYALGRLPLALRLRAIKALCFKECGFYPESSHIEAVSRGIDACGEKRFSLPGGYTAVTCNGFLSFKKSGVCAESLVLAPLCEGNNYFAGGAVRVELRYGAFRKGLELYDKLMFSVSLDRASVSGRLYVRPRRSGDCFTVRGINRNLKKCFINKKIPASLRESIPVICDDAGIAYVPFIGAADRVYNSKSKDTCNITVSIERDGQLR